MAETAEVPLKRLTRRADFLRTARARRRQTPGFLLQARRREPDEPGGDAARVGLTCSRRVGNAVARNRAKRRLRELARLVLPHGALPGWDYVLIGRATTTASRNFATMQHELAMALAEVHR